MKTPHVWFYFAFLVLLAITAPANAEPPRTLLLSPPRIGGRVVKELVLTAPLRSDASLPPGLPMVPTYTISPNRFIPVSEDPTHVFYQAEGTFAEGKHETGGLRVSKTHPDQVFVYWGNARYPKIKLVSWDRFSRDDLRKLRIRFADSP